VELSLKMYCLKILAVRKKSLSTKTKRRSLMVPANLNALKGRIKGIEDAARGGHSEYDGEKLRERLAKLVGGVAIIKVGAANRDRA